ncbi:MAG: aldo/keto reductase [Candidatus Lokiarchaeota archaeon]|nr:aldo/keto reductase [Candidatus Lokiarchaeota archaeon]
MDKLEQRKLGASNVIVPPMGIGTMLWNSKKSKTKEDILQAYRSGLDNGVNFFDTAEMYSKGNSERMLAECFEKDGRPIIISSKFAPPSSMIPMSPKRSTVPKKSPRALMEALDGSLKRLGIDCIDLYQIHAPPSHNTIEEYMDVMAEAVNAGKVRAVGVCNFTASQLRKAHARLAEHDIPLATEMVGYNLLRRYPETNGVFKACRELNITLIPYSPLSQGILTGKYRNRKKKPSFVYRVLIYFGHLNIVKERDDSRSFIRKLFSKPLELDDKKIEPLFTILDEIAIAHDKTLAQVAINWLITTEEICVIPIPGVRNLRQMNDNIGTLGWHLTKEERALINKIEIN